MIQLLHLVGVALSGLACLLIVIAIGTTSWMVAPNVFSYGIFRICTSRIAGCVTYDPTTTEIAVRFFVVVGFLMTVTGLIVAIFYFVKFAVNDVTNKTLPLVAALEFFVAGVAVIIGAIIFAAKVRADFIKSSGTNPDIGFSFGLAIVGALFCFGAAALVMVQRSKAN